MQSTALDPAFALPRFGSTDKDSEGTCRAIALDGKGRILVGGDFRWVNGVARTNLVRLRSDGVLDESFVPRIKVQVPEQNTVVVQNDGKILVPDEDLWLARLEADGSVDDSFRRLAIGSVNDVALTPSGKIYVAGKFEGLRTGGRRYLVRLNADGTIDESFRAAIEQAPWMETGLHLRVAIQPDNKVVLAGAFRTKDGTSYMARFNEDGSEDADFRNSAPVPDYCEALLVSSDGSIFHGWRRWQSIINAGTGQWALLNQYGADRALKKEVLHPEIPGIIFDLALQPDRKILLGGRLFDDSIRGNGNLVRLNPDGSLDRGFEIGKGFYSHKYPIHHSGEVHAIVIDQGGRILVGGFFDRYNETECGGLVRLEGEAAYLMEHAVNATGVRYRWETTRRDVAYGVETSRDLRDWSLAEGATVDGREVSYSVPAASGAGFSRLVISPAAEVLPP